MTKIASPLYLLGTACAYIGTTLVLFTAMVNTPSISFCARNQEIVDISLSIKTQEVSFADNKAVFDCIWHNNTELYSAGSRAVHFVQIHSVEIVSYSLFFFGCSLGAAIFLRSLGFLLTWK